MKLLAAFLAIVALIASPVVAQPDNNTVAAKTVHVKTTTKHIHETNVPVRKHHRTRHHAARCGCPPSHMKAHHAKTHHIVKKTTTTTKTPS